MSPELPPALQSEIVELVERVSIEERVPARLLKAIVIVESAGKPDAVRFEPEWRNYASPREWASRHDITPATEAVLQATSWGLCQVMGATARDLGFSGMLTDLLEPELSLRMGARMIRKLMHRYGEDAESDIVAAYNAGSARTTPSGFYVNQRYVDKVFAVLREA